MTRGSWPLPRKSELSVLVYAPHFLGIALGRDPSREGKSPVDSTGSLGVLSDIENPGKWNSTLELELSI